MTTAAATVDYLEALPWFAVSDPDEPTPLYDALAAEHAAARPCGTCSAAGDEPCVTRGGKVVVGGHVGRGRG